MDGEKDKVAAGSPSADDTLQTGKLPKELTLRSAGSEADALRITSRPPPIIVDAKLRKPLLPRWRAPRPEPPSMRRVLWVGLGLAALALAIVLVRHLLRR